ncbi:HAD-like domain [Pseudocohnilembus persalinus]|uniref:HAD-like domain n=1 Tax=Pseudocohnilembus persalinus TaxID=266149 RepID=A0A0V0QMS6_PSEPJ|nr:HAD-like domain [Pseudocohnilembus persalinus]|eukprot:KRX03533.1 HAD-like domain [Pseudocohnilembus persalinus]
MNKVRQDIFPVDKKTLEKIISEQIQMNQQCQNLLSEQNSQLQIQHEAQGLLLNNKVTKIDQHQILVGDIIFLEAGDDIDFDGVIVESQKLLIDESNITGQTKLEEKYALDTNKYEFYNSYIKSASYVSSGKGKVLVTNVNIQEQKLSEQDQMEKNDQMNILSGSTLKIVKTMIFIGFIISIIILIALCLYSIEDVEKDDNAKFLEEKTLEKFVSNFIEAFLVLVLSVPEGLPLVIILTLAYGSRQLQNKNIIIRSMNAVEVMGGDQIRTQSKYLVSELHKSYVNPLIITGDVQQESERIAQQIGILSPNQSDINQEIIKTSQILQNSENSSMKQPYELKRNQQNGFSNIKVFTEASPEDKQLIVQKFQDQNSIVAYIGDGNNDYLGLTKSDIGITLGISGTNLAKQSSKIILQDDNLNNIELCINWGRHLLLTIQRFVFFQLTFFIVSSITMLVCTLFFKNSPFSVLQVVWLSLIHDIFSAFALSLENPEENLRHIQKPYCRGYNIFERRLNIHMATQSGYQTIISLFLLYATPLIFNIPNSQQYQINQITTQYKKEQVVHFTILYHATAILQLFLLINARNFKRQDSGINIFTKFNQSKPFFYIIFMCYILQNLTVYYGSEYFNCAPLTILENLFCHLIGLSSSVLFVFIDKRMA